MSPTGLVFCVDSLGCWALRSIIHTLHPWWWLSPLVPVLILEPQRPPTTASVVGWDLLEAFWLYTVWWGSWIGARDAVATRVHPSKLGYFRMHVIRCVSFTASSFQLLTANSMFCGRLDTRNALLWKVIVSKVLTFGKVLTRYALRPLRACAKFLIYGFQA